MATPSGNDLSDKTESARESLRTLVDELRLQMHLGSMDAKESWEDLEPQLKRMESRLDSLSLNLKQASDEAELQAHLAAREAKDRWEALQDSLSDVVENLVESVVDTSRAPKRVIDRSKVQAHLARLEAEDRLEQAADELKSRLQSSRSDVVQEAARFVDGLSSAFLHLRDRLKRDH